VKVVPPDDEGSLHLGAYHSTSQDSPTYANVSGERALLVNVASVDGFIRGLEAKADVLVPAFGDS
jgi:hypothetical protein